MDSAVSSQEKICNRKTRVIKKKERVMGLAIKSDTTFILPLFPTDYFPRIKARAAT